MGVTVLHLEIDQFSPAFTWQGRGAIKTSDSAPSPSTEGILGLRDLAHIESTRWRLVANRTRGHADLCKRVIGDLMKQAAVEGNVFKGLTPEDRDWILDNIRPLRTALREVVNSRSVFCRQPHIQGRGGQVRTRSLVIADLFLYASNFCFDPGAFSAYLDGWQENQNLEMGELWALKQALQLSVLEQLARNVAPLLGHSNPALLFVPVAGHFAIPRLITAIRDIGEADWERLFEQISVVDKTLRRDPTATYQLMDEESRALYRMAIADLASHSSRSESQVAAGVVEMAQAAANQITTDPRITERESHIGYYLADAGLPRLRHAVGYRPCLKQRVRDLLLRYPNACYLVGIEILTFLIVTFVLAGLPHLSSIVAGFFFLFIPASQAAVELMNAVVTSMLPARHLPKMDFSQGIPDRYRTMVAVPTLLLSEKQVQDLVEGIEVRYLANRDPNLYFALLTDAPDSHHQFDASEALTAFCSCHIRELNRRYGHSGKGPFFLFHRRRMFNPSQGVWMGWERKRGKLLDLCRLLRGDQEKFPVKVGDLSVLPQIRFVISLDSDTQLPRDAAHRLVGALAHPLNRAVINPATNTVISGYGILQPRVGISVHSAGRSRLASTYSGQTGFDIYTRAVSDVYQDLYGEGIFTGKGIFDVDVFQQVLDERFPCNALLSHDLIEGAYARAALVSDIEVIDDYPSHFSAYCRRKHRWVRGDWQIAQWLFRSVPDFHNHMVPNPTSVVSRWKIFDNLRRSLIDPCLFGLLLAGWFFLPGRAWYWTLATMGLLSLTVYAHALMSLVRSMSLRRLPATLRSISVDLAKGHVNVLLALTFLPHQALVMIDAIVRTLVRQRITRLRLLEWETAAEAESAATTPRPADIYLAWTPWIALGLTLILAVSRPEICLYALPFLLLWANATGIARWLSRGQVVARPVITASQKRFLRTSALHIWRYFQENSGPGENWLVPDNVQESPCTSAHRISPTNLGLLLNARQAAYDLGYLTLPEFVALTERTLSAAAKLAKHRGHFFNWYDTLTLEPLDPAVISTVDSGNLAASLWTLKQHCLLLVDGLVFPPSVWQGLRDHIHILYDFDPERARELDALAQEFGNDGWKWFTGLDSVERETQALSSGPSENVRWWAGMLLERTSAIRSLADALAPWFGAIDQNALRGLVGDPGLNLAGLTLGRVDILADHLRSTLKPHEFDKINDAILRAAVTAETLRSKLRRLATEAGRLVDEMDFRFLYDERKKLLSVGYGVSSRQLHPARYDLLASEARMASFVAIAKGDIPQKAWFHLGRSQTSWEGRPILLSWTGTIFEYLMPTLWMKIYPRTIWEQSARAVVAMQRAYSRKLQVPWGISESAYAARDDDGNYQYHAFGLPMLALKRVFAPPRVIASYAAFLALAVNPAAAIRNLRRMWKHGWAGRYGFYEAVDFSGGPEPTVVRCWMAHHHAMSLMAIANCLLESPFQRFFHSEPQVMATELLLHEKVPIGLRVELEPYLAPPAGARSRSTTKSVKPFPLNALGVDNSPFRTAPLGPSAVQSSVVRRGWPGRRLINW
jgi:cyclic beta-1,2-glucan synthetase